MERSSSPLSSLSSLTPSPVQLQSPPPLPRSPSPPRQARSTSLEAGPLDAHRDKRLKLSPALPPTESAQLPHHSTPAVPQPTAITSTAAATAFRPLPTSPLTDFPPSVLPVAPTPNSPPRSRTTHTIAAHDVDALLQDLEDNDFNYLPSSDLQPSSLHPRTHPDDHHIVIEDDDEAEDQEINVEKNATEIDDDSGFFLPADISSAATSKRIGGLVATSQLEEMVGENIIDEEDFEGDDMWIGYSEPEVPIHSEDLPTSSTTAFAPISTFPSKVPVTDFPSSTAVSDDESDYDREWDNGPAPTFGGMELGGFGGFGGAGGGGGFTTGGGKKVAAPSEASILRSAAALARDPTPSPDRLPVASTSTVIPKPVGKFSLPRIPPPPVRSTQPAFISARSAASTTGFANARGGAIYAPSEAATERAAKLLNSSPPVLLRSGSRDARLIAPVAFGGFTSAFNVARDVVIDVQDENEEGDVFVTNGESGRGTLFDPKMKGANGEGREPLLRMDDNSQPSHADTPTRRTRTESSSPLPLLPPTTRIAPTKTPSAAPRFHPPTHSTPNGFSSVSRAPPTVSETPLASTSKIPIRPPSTLRSTIPGFRPPLLASTSKPSPVPSTIKSTPLKPAPALRRLNISMTPRPRSIRKHKFSSPFRGGVRPEGLTPMGIVQGEKVTTGMVGTGGSGSAVKGKGKGKAKEVGDVQADSVFDLTVHGERQNLVEYGIAPQGLYFEQLRAAGLPVDLLSLDATTSKLFVFPCGRGATEAYARLIEVGCTFMTDAWVENHWSLIVWKLASLVRSKRDELKKMWNWEYAMDQLFYRYEREINLAQRSSVKRIQEQDSSASIPLVLCVTEIRWAEPPEARETNPDEEPLLVIAGLELTDGWYRIRANIDLTLRSAVERGKIVVGCKLAISGARLDGSREANDVLEALTRSSLVLTGNSCALAPWHATLGFVKTTFIASLESLTSAGGVAPLLDVVVEKIYPYGYIDMSKNGQHAIWDEEEERIKADEWITGREKAQGRLADLMEKSTDDSRGLRNMLEDALSRFDGGESVSQELSSQEGADEILERIESHKSNKRAIIRSLSSRQVRDCLALVNETAMNSHHSAVADLETELRVAFPPRDVRGFRAIRIRDGATERRKLSERTALLTVWDANSLGSDFLIEGKRYLVSNVVPKGSWKRKSSEISLATRRDSRWRTV